MMRQHIFVFLALWATGTSAQSRVAFSGVQTVDQSFDGPVTFDRIDANLGDAFDGTTFTAPVQGLYLFTFTGFSNEMLLHLRVNDVVMRSAEIDVAAQYSSEENVASNSVILELNFNDKVHVSLLGTLYSSFDDIFFTQFSGTLLYESTVDVTAFSAAKTDDQFSDVIDTAITYDVIQTDVGNAFDGTTFVAPDTGLYLFTFAARGTHFVVELKVNGNTRRSVVFQYSSSSSSYYDNAFSNYMMLLLNKDDQVATFLAAPAGDSLRNADSSVYVTEFSGVLLAKTSAAASPSDIGHQLEDNFVAFSATMTLDMEKPAVDAPLVFDSVDCNINSTATTGFDGQSKFIVPVDGYYLFTYSFKTDDAKIHLKVNDFTRRTAARLSGLENGYNELGTTSAILFLNQNDEVQLFMSSESVYDDNLVNSGDVRGATHFSGLLLYTS